MLLYFIGFEEQFIEAIKLVGVCVQTYVICLLFAFSKQKTIVFNQFDVWEPNSKNIFLSVSVYLRFQKIIFSTFWNQTVGMG